MYKRHRFPLEIIQHAVWLYHRFDLSGCDIEDLMAERSIGVSYVSIRQWCIKFGSTYAKRIRRRHQGYGDTFYLDEDGAVIDVFPLARRVDRQQNVSSSGC